MPFHLGRESWFPYDTSSAWFWRSGALSTAPKKRIGGGPLQ
jgi:hypothetical protein